MQEKPGNTSAFSLSVICNNTIQYCASSDNLYAFCVPFQLSLTYYIHIWKCIMQVCRIYNLEHLVRRIMRTYYIISHLCNNWSKDKVLHSKIKAKKWNLDNQQLCAYRACDYFVCLCIRTSEYIQGIWTVSNYSFSASALVSSHAECAVAEQHK